MIPAVLTDSLEETRSAVSESSHNDGRACEADIGLKWEEASSCQRAHSGYLKGNKTESSVDKKRSMVKNI